MHIKLSLLKAVCILFVLIALDAPAYSAQASNEGNKNSTVFQPQPLAPDFSLKDLKGKLRSLKDFRGKVVLLNFTTTWCPYCKRDIPNLKRLYSSMKGKDFELISIYVKESPEKVAAFAQKYELPYTILLDSQAVVARAYGIQGVPTKFVVAKRGIIGCGMCVSPEVEAKINEFIKSK